MAAQCGCIGRRRKCTAKLGSVRLAATIHGSLHRPPPRPIFDTRDDGDSWRCHQTLSSARGRAPTPGLLSLPPIGERAPAVFFQIALIGFTLAAAFARGKGREALPDM